MKMKYLSERNGVLRYRRAYPPDVQHVLGKEYVVSFKTRDRAAAMPRYAEHDRLFEMQVALARSQSDNSTETLKVREIAQNVGFLQLPDKLDNIRVPELVQIVGQNLDIFWKLPKSGTALAALAQTVSATLSIDEVFAEYQRIERDKLRKKTNREKKKFLAPIKLAIKEFKELVGDVDILKLKKKTVLGFKDKLTTEVAVGKITAGTANKKVMHLRKIFEVVRENIYPELENPFSIKALENDEVDKRPSFLESDIEKIDAALAKSIINDELKAMMFIARNTGCGPKELALMTATDIFLDTSFPFIRIDSNEFRRKVKGGKARHREIPLVGPALEWMKKFPTGFIRYQKDNGGEAASAAANKFLKRHTGKTFYSFRHRFADLLRNTGCDQRVQNSIFGHASKNRIEDHYGNPDMVMRAKYEAILKAVEEGPNLLKEDQEKRRINERLRS